MARKVSRSRSRRSSVRSRSRSRQPDKSVLTKGQLYLNHHDEEKVLLFATGIVFGVGLAASLLDKFFFGGLVALVVALVLVFLENNQKLHDQ
jgi:hypothetical protein